MQGISVGLERKQRRLGDPDRETDVGGILPFDAENFSFAFPHHLVAGPFQFYPERDRLPDFICAADPEVRA